MGAEFKEATMSLAGATFAAGDFSRGVLDHVKTRTSVRLNVSTDNIAGVKLPIFVLRGEDEQDDDHSLLGMTGGGQAIQRAREAYTRFLKVLITIASLQTQFVTLDMALKITNRRVNALEFILIPKILDTIDYIDRELDEESREDFYRLKKVTDNKKKAKQATRFKMGLAQVDENAEENVMPAAFKGEESDDDDVFV